MARDDENSAVSLFSFQDIITCITGIMFLVVLLLLLVAITSRPKPPQPSSPDETPALTARIAELERRLAQFNRQDNSLAQRLEQLRQLSPVELAARLKELQQTLAALRRETDDAEEQQRRTESAIAELRREIEQLERRCRTAAGTEAAATEKIRQLAAELERKQQEAAQRRKVMDYAIDRSFPRTPILAEVGKNGVRILRLAENRTYDFRVADHGSAGVGKFLEWARTQPARREYFCILAQPGGFRYAEDILTALKQMGFERGIEILPGDDATIFAGDTP